MKSKIMSEYIIKDFISLNEYEVNGLYTIYSEFYLKKIGKIWDFETFLIKLNDNKIIFNKNGFLSIKKIDSFYKAMIGAGDSNLIIKTLKYFDEPIFCLVDDYMLRLVKLSGFIEPNENNIDLIRNIKLTSNFYEIQVDGAILVEYNGIGSMYKHFMANKKFYEMLTKKPD